MTGWLIAAAVIVLLAVLPLGVGLTYRDTVFTVRARIAGLPVTVFTTSKDKKKKPKKNKKKTDKPKKSAKEKPKGEKPKKEKTKLSLALVKIYLTFAKEVLTLLGRRARILLRSIVISKLYVHFVVATDDAARTATQYGEICAAVSAVYPVYRTVLPIQNHDVTIDVDFCRDKPVVDAAVRIRTTLGALVVFAVTVAFGALVCYFRMEQSKKAMRPEEPKHVYSTDKDKAVQENE